MMEPIVALIQATLIGAGIGAILAVLVCSNRGN